MPTFVVWAVGIATVVVAYVVLDGAERWHRWTQRHDQIVDARAELETIENWVEANRDEHL